MSNQPPPSPLGPSHGDFQISIPPQGIISALGASSKEDALAALAERAAILAGADPHIIYRALVEREKLGTTGIGTGAAIPHGRIAGLQHPCIVFARLAAPIPFEAIDERPVDLLFLLLSPERDNTAHLKALSRIARLLRDTNLCRALRGATTAEGVHTLLSIHLTGSFA